MHDLDTVAVPRCPVCGGTGAAALHEGLTDRVFCVAPGAWTLRGCEDCGAARLDPRPADDAIASLYAAYYTHDPPQPNIVPAGRMARALRALGNAHLNSRLGYHLAPAWRAGALAGRLAPPLAAIAERPVRSLPLAGRVLDVGCGNGLFVAEAAAAGWQASGIDLDESAVAAGRSAGLDLAVQAIDDRADQEPGGYDAVTLSHVIEHVPDPVAFLRSALKLLRPGGLVWIATPNLAAAGHRRYGADWLHLDPPRHLVLFDHPSLARTLAEAGFAGVRPLRPTPVAGPSFRKSQGVRDGVRPADQSPPAPPAVRLRALLADAGAQLRFGRGEELLVIARRP